MLMLITSDDVKFTNVVLISLQFLFVKLSKSMHFSFNVMFYVIAIYCIVSAAFKRGSEK